MTRQTVTVACSGLCDRHTWEQVDSSMILHGCVHLVEKIEQAIQEAQGAIVLNYGEQRLPELGYVALCESCISTLEQATEDEPATFDVRRWPLRTPAKLPKVS